MASDWLGWAPSARMWKVWGRASCRRAQRSSLCSRCLAWSSQRVKVRFARKVALNI